MSGQRSFFPPPPVPTSLSAPPRAPLLAAPQLAGTDPSGGLQIPPHLILQHQQQMVAAHLAATSANVPTSILRVGPKGTTNGLPGIRPLSSIPLPRAPDAAPKDTATPQASSSAAQDEPEYEWIEYLSADGKPYYHNRTTKVTTWNKPDRYRPAGARPPAAAAAASAQQTAASAVAPAALTRKWREYKTEDGRSYFHNHETKETTWTRPPDFDGDDKPSDSATTTTSTKKEIVPKPIPRAERLTEEIPLPGSSVVDLPSIDLNAISMPPKVKSSPQTPAADDGKSDMERAMEATLRNLPPPIPPTLVSSPAERATAASASPPAETREEQMAKFRQLLVDKYTDGRLKTSMTWEQALKHIQHDARFRAMNKISEKKRIFNEWKVQQQKDERDARKLALRKAKEDFEYFLLHDRRIIPGMPYAKADRIFGTEEVWRALGDGDRRDIYRDTIGLVRRKREEEARELVKRCRPLVVDLFNALPNITYRTPWAEAHRVLTDARAFRENADFRRLHKADLLQAFMDYIHGAEREHALERLHQEKMLRREERKIRDAFHTLLDELHQRGAVAATTKWTDIYPTIRQDVRFTTMLSQSGSTPLDIFKFYVDELRARYSRDRRRIRDIMERADIRVTADTTFEEFERRVRDADEAAKDVDAGNLNLYFLTLLDKNSAAADASDTGGDAKHKEKDRSHKREKKQKKHKKHKKEKKHRREKGEASASDDKKRAGSSERKRHKSEKDDEADGSEVPAVEKKRRRRDREDRDDEKEEAEERRSRHHRRNDENDDQVHKNGKPATRDDPPTPQQQKVEAVTDDDEDEGRSPRHKNNEAGEASEDGEIMETD